MREYFPGFNSVLLYRDDILCCTNMWHLTLLCNFFVYDKNSFFSSLLVRVIDIPLQIQIINVAWRDGKHAFACCRADYLCRD